MQKRLIILLACAVLAGCRDGQFIRDAFTSSACSGSTFSGYTLTGLTYGDSQMVVLPVSTIRPESEFRIKLIPQTRPTDPPVNYKDVVITIDSTDDDADTPADWLKATGSFNSATGGWLTMCVPPAGGLTRSTYKFSVKMTDTAATPDEDLGWLDPRADVEL